MYTLVGLGYGGVRLKLYEELEPSEEDPWLSGETQGERIDRDLGTSGSLLKLALGTDYQLVFDDYKGILGALILGFRIGYDFALTGWKLDGVNPRQKPDVGITGPYFHLMLGFGGSGQNQQQGSSKPNQLPQNK